MHIEKYMTKKIELGWSLGRVGILPHASLIDACSDCTSKAIVYTLNLMTFEEINNVLHLSKDELNLRK
jgi:hypothetical protein